MTEEYLIEKAKSLCNGEIVWVSGLQVKAKQITEDEIACNLCDMGSACDAEMNLQCAMCDTISGHAHLLYLPNQDCI